VPGTEHVDQAQSQVAQPLTHEREAGLIALFAQAPAQQFLFSPAHLFAEARGVGSLEALPLLLNQGWRSLNDGLLGLAQALSWASAARAGRRVPEHLSTANALRGSGRRLVSARHFAQHLLVMVRVLFLCTGNYFRSRFAEQWFNHCVGTRQLHKSYQAGSAGLQVEASSGNVGPMAVEAIAALGACRT